MSNLPASVLSRVESSPAVEEFLLPLLRQELEGVPFFSLIPVNVPGLCALVRQALGPGVNHSDPRGFLEDVYVEIDSFTSDPDGDQDGKYLAKAISMVLRDAWLNRTVINNTWISEFNMPDEPARKADFADSSGPVQYADLFAGYWRYQGRYNLLLRHNLS